MTEGDEARAHGHDSLLKGVLVVSLSSELRQWAFDWLSRQGFRADAVATGEAAQRRLERDRYHAVLAEGEFVALVNEEPVLELNAELCGREEELKSWLQQHVPPEQWPVLPE